MTRLADAWSHAAWTQFWQVTLLIAVVTLAVRLTARNRPYLAYALWLVVLVKCLTPPVICSPAGVFCWIQTAPDPPRLPTRWTQVELSPSASGALEMPAAAPTAVERRFEQADEDPSVRPATADPGASLATWLFATWLFATWCLGALAVLATTGIRLLAGWRRLRRAGFRRDPSLDQYTAALARRLRLRQRVRVIVTNSQVGPAVLGLVRPTVLVPEIILRGKALHELEPILAHELLHVRRGDLWVGLLQVLVQALWWFYPLVWWTTRLVSREAERCCDEAVVAELGCSPARYARSLFDVLQRKRTLKPLPMFPGVRPVELTSNRLERIMQFGQGSRKRSPWWCWAVMSLSAAATLPGAAMVVGAGEPNAATAPALAASSPADKKSETYLYRNYPAGDLLAAAHSTLGITKQEARRRVEEAIADNVDSTPRPAGLERGVAWSGSDLIIGDTEPGHDRVLESLTRLRTYGFHRIAVKARWITGPAVMIDSLDIAWSRLEDVCPAASEDPLGQWATEAWGEGRAKQDAPVGIARQVRGGIIPIRLAVVDEEAVNVLLDNVQRLSDSDLQNQRRGRLWRQVGRLAGYTADADVRERVRVLQVPRVHVLNGQQCLIQDVSKTPFVVSVERVRGEWAEAYQPVIRVVDEGVKLRVQPQYHGAASIQLACELTWSHVLDVDTFTFDRDEKGDKGVTVQVPDVEVASLKAAAEVPVGKTLLIGGLKSRNSDGQRESMLVLLTPTKPDPKTPNEPISSPNAATGVPVRPEASDGQKSNLGTGCELTRTGASTTPAVR